MNKYIISALLILFLLLSSCAAPEESGVPPTTAVSAQSTAEAKPPTADELRTLIGELQKSGDVEGLYQVALELLTLEPGDAEAYRIALDALVAMSRANYEEINRLLVEVVENVDDPSEFEDWVDDNRPDFAVSMPFQADVSQELYNTVGITAGNMTNAGKYEEFGGWWISGLSTFQGDYVYLSFPGENFAIYKMRADGSQHERLGQLHGTNLNVVGEWLYFQNRDDESRMYKVRTDGSMSTPITEEGAEFITVVGEQAFFHSWEDGCLYRINTDGSGKEMMVDSVVMFVTVWDGHVYYTEKSDKPSLKRVPIDGGKPEEIIEYKNQPYLIHDENGTESYIDIAAPFVQSYLFRDGWVYYFDFNNPKGILRAGLDERKYEVFFPFDMRITSINISGDALAISFWNERPYEKDGFLISEEIVTIDMQTLDKLNHTAANTEPIIEGPDGWVYFFDANDNYAWYGMHPDGEVIRIGE